MIDIRELTSELDFYYYGITNYRLRRLPPFLLAACVLFRAARLFFVNTYFAIRELTSELDFLINSL